MVDNVREGALPMMRTRRAVFTPVLVTAVLLAAGPAWAGGSNYGLAPGSRPALEGKVSEWAVPTPRFARDPAPGPDGNIYVAVMQGNRIARFDTATSTFTEWDLPEGARPHGLLVDRAGIVWYTGHGNGTIGRLDPATGRVTEHKAPSGGDPHTLVIDEHGIIWFTVSSGNRIGRLDTRSGAITEYRTSGRPYGLALGPDGHVWFCRIYADKLGRLDPRTGTIADVQLGAGSQPRRIAAGPDGSLWVTLYGTGKLARVDSRTGRIVKEYPLPAGATGGPYAVNVDGAGIVWVNEIQTDTVVRLDPATGALRVFPLPSQGVGIRKMAVDAQGRLWYMGSHNGRLGVIQ
jgi:virginiamycin B lyase